VGDENFIHNFSRKPERKRSHRDAGMEDSVKMDLKDIGCGYVDWIHWVQDRGQL
jgi:hypothetical protein